MDYNYIMVTRSAGIGDLLMLEPTIEALYYKFAPARIILRTHWDYAWVLQGSPFIWKTIFDSYHNRVFGLPEHNTLIHSDLNGELEKEEPIRCFCYHNMIEAFKNLHGIDTFAMSSDVRLLRRTPAVSNFNFPENHKIVVQLRQRNDGRDFLGDSNPLTPLAIDHLEKAGAQFIGLEPMGNSDFRDLISGCDMFIGPDSSGLHLAYAAGVKKIIGYYIDRYPAEIRAYPGMISARNPLELERVIETMLEVPKYPDYLNQNNSVDFIRGKALTHCQGRGVEIHSDRVKLCETIPSLDWGMPAVFEPLDFIFSSHYLSGVEEWKSHLLFYEANIREGGTLFLYLPHPRMEKWLLGGEWVGDSHKWIPEPVMLAKYFNENTSLKVMEYTSYPDPYWSFYMVLKKASRF